MKINFTLVVSVLAIAGLLVAAGGLGYMLYNAMSENAKLHADLATTALTLNDTSAKLETTYDKLELALLDLGEKDNLLGERNRQIQNLSTVIAADNAKMKDYEKQLNETNAELQQTSDTLNRTKEELTGIGNDITNLENKVDSSIQWFKTNANMSAQGNTTQDFLLNLHKEGFVYDVSHDCSDGTTLKLSCVSFLLEKHLAFKYISESVDRLYSLNEMLARSGGDCEDYALFFKAAINSLNRSDVTLESWSTVQNGMKYSVYNTNKEQWYIDSAEGVPIGKLSQLRPYSVCYLTHNFGTGKIGHCIIMFSDKNLTSGDQASTEFFRDAPLVEPQTGGYTGTVGTNLMVCRNGELGCDDNTGYIIFIITDDDLYQFSDGRWNYYGYYKDELERKKAEINSFLNIY